ncbi:chromate transporter [Carnobacteriaceae bacterium zg-C25]|nr:chromate transporter [Carnobacteriaceae bacterium zg-C25]
MILFQLFLAFFQIGLVGFGGGYAILAYLQDVIVHQNAWLNMTGYTDLLTLSQMTPGPVSINAATFVGMKMSGVIGAVVATFSFVAPTFIITLTLAMIYYKYKNLSSAQLVLNAIRPAMIALIASVGYDLVVLLIDGQVVFKVTLLLLGIVAVRKYKVNPIVMMLSLGFINVVVNLLI